MEFRTYIERSTSYSEYNNLVKKLVTEGKTTGEEQTEVKVDFTKLNLSRTKRLDKTAVLSEEANATFKNIETPQTWLVITEAWCGDAAQSLPYLNKMAEASDKIDLRIVLRDENEALMNAYLTNGSKSIPKLIILDSDLNEIANWGPRSKNAAKLVIDYKAEHGQIDDILKTNLQLWYNKDKGVSIVKELIPLTKEIQFSESISE